MVRHRDVYSLDASWYVLAVSISPCEHVIDALEDIYVGYLSLKLSTSAVYGVSCGYKLPMVGIVNDRTERPLEGSVTQANNGNIDRWHARCLAG